MTADSERPKTGKFATVFASGVFKEVGTFANPALAFLFSVWVTHAILRVFLIFRKDAFGSPFVGKPDWYIFHAFAIDAWWIVLWSLPILILLLICGVAHWSKAARSFFWLLGGLHSVLLLCTVADHETMRFMGMHLDLSSISTYGNSAAIREVFTFVAADKSVPYLSLGIFIACVPLTWIFYFAFFRNRSWVRRPGLALGAWLGTLAVVAAAYLFLNIIWTGGFRMLKLRPFVSTVLISLANHKSAQLAAVDLSQLGKAFQKQWQLEQGDSTFIFPDSTYPFYKVPVGHDSSIVVPPKGKPPNIVMLILESHRGVNCGYLKPYGAIADATPVMDSLAAGQAHAWTRFACSGIPTINALMSIHLSILSHPSRIIASDFTTLRHNAFTAVLGRHGYRTHFFSAADPAWDGQVPWLRQWYQGVTYDRSRETDDATLQNMAQWMKDSLNGERPFLVTAMTKTNHYPFNHEPGVRTVPAGASLQEKMLATMEYTDASIGRFLTEIKHEPWFDNTIVLILADHGFPLSEHGSSNIGFGLYTESVWIPFLMLGHHPRMGNPELHDYPASQLDIGPTVLALAGIQEANHYLGHDLFRRTSGMNSLSYLVRGEQGSLEYGSFAHDSLNQQYFRIHEPLGEIPREQGREIFNTRIDKAERKNLLNTQDGVGYDSLVHFLRAVTQLNTNAVEANALWPDSSQPNTSSRSK